MRFSVSVSSAIRWASRAAQQGNPATRKQGRALGKVPLVGQLDYLIAAVAAKPDITMLELAAQLQTERGIGAGFASPSRLLCRAGSTYKNS